MILITVGTQKFPFDRLLKKVDELAAEKKMTEEIFAQIGCSSYVPKNYRYKKYLTAEEMQMYLKGAEIVVTHGGTASIVEAVKMGKKVVAVPRLKKYGEHVDDHQKEIIEEFDRERIICGVFDLERIGERIDYAKRNSFQPYISRRQNVIDELRKIIHEERTKGKNETV